jgi:hypothetical protein
VAFQKRKAPRLRGWVREVLHFDPASVSLICVTGMSLCLERLQDERTAARRWRGAANDLSPAFARIGFAVQTSRADECRSSAEVGLIPRINGTLAPRIGTSNGKL